MKRISRRVFMIGASSTAFMAYGAPSAMAAEAKPGLDDTIAEYASRDHCAGVSACVMKGGEVLWEGAGGWADISNKCLMTTDTIQNIGSVSKTVTATAVMQLVESKRLDLEADINEYLDFSIRNPRHAQKPITVQSLLTHHSSIIDGPAYEASYACGDPTIALKDWIASVLAPAGEHFHPNRYFGSKEPGDLHKYSNIGYGVLGLLVETVSGTPFDAYCRDRIFAPLDMTNTGWRIDSIDRATHAIPYEKLSRSRGKMAPLVTRELKDKGFSELCLYSFPNYPDGLVRTSVKQFGRFVSAYMSDTVLQPDTIGRMLKEEAVLADNSIQGLCWVTWDTDRGRVWYHSGGDPGIATVAAFDPVSKAVVVLFSTGFGERGMLALFESLLAHARSR